MTAPDGGASRPHRLSVAEQKRAAGAAAAQLVTSGMRLGVGSGSTVNAFLDALADRGLHDLAGVPSSEETAVRCRERGIALLDPADVDGLDLAIDGADEFDADLNATKGGGGALLREKVVATMSRRFVLIATPDKAVDRLGRTFPLPVEVVPFALGPVRRTLTGRGLVVVTRSESDGAPYRTDNGNAVIDVRYPEGIADPAAEDIALTLLPGVVTSGLFVEMARDALLAHADGTVEHRRPGHAPAPPD